MDREQKIQELIKNGLIPTVETGVMDSDGQYQFQALIIEPLKGDEAYPLTDNVNEKDLQLLFYDDYFKALDFAIKKGFELLY